MGDVTVVGMTELGANITKLTSSVGNRIVRKASTAGAEVFRKEVRANAPVREEGGRKGSQFVGSGKNTKIGRPPGYLKRHIGRSVTKNGDGSLSVFVGPTKSAFYGKFQELGTSNQPARPFMRPSFESKKAEAERRFAEVASEEIMKEFT